MFRIDLKGDELHKKLGGGIPRNAFVLIEAENAIGKSALAQRFIYGALTNKHTATYISSEMTLVGFMNQMKSLHYDIKSKILNKDLLYISLFPAFSDITFRAHLIETLLGAQQLFEKDIIVFDTLSELLVKQEMSLQECFDFASHLKKVAGKDKAIVFCVDPSRLNEALLSMLKSVSDVYISMGSKEIYGKSVKVMRVQRFNGAMNDVEEEIAYKVKAGVGIVPELAG
ncbi:MAG: hypothetical protein OXR66_05580 [Candidatus Woesearchaeota archaeon]|nr:hypothetical protein [Candidatus Woesearchaeota archaeon]